MRDIAGRSQLCLVMMIKAPGMATQKDGWLPLSWASASKGAPGSMSVVARTARTLPGAQRVPSGCLSLWELTLSLIGFKMGPFSIKQGLVVQTFWT